MRNFALISIASLISFLSGIIYLIGPALGWMEVASPRYEALAAVLPWIFIVCGVILLVIAIIELIKELI